MTSRRSETTLEPAADPHGSQGAAPDVVRGSRWNWRTVVERQEFAVFIVAVILFVYFGASSPQFLTEFNIVTLVDFIAPVAVISFGEVMLLTLGEMDLSAGTIFIFMPFVTQALFSAGVPLLLAILITLVVGALIGVVNGLIVVVFGLPSFITTLGTLFALDGIMLVVTNANEATMPTSGTTVEKIFGLGRWSEILWALAMLIVMYLILHRSRMGLHITATGGNRTGAAEAGIPVKRVIVWAFVMSGVLSTLIGIIDATRVGTIDPGDPGTTEMFYAMAAAVIGGTATTGGRGTQIGAVIGATVFGILYVGFTLKGINANAFVLILGIAILVAMAVNVQLSRVTQRRGGSKGRRSK